ncbi:beta-eliminating lyase-related protein [Kitasatospora cineracea]|uniref:beta-eliminating lyase-related protein n=1 Tax=Kitasatospora cineracea TaxID=88074 RepID=UPI0036DF0870
MPGARSYRRFEDVVRELTGHKHVLPVHQGRAAERILFNSLPVQRRITLSDGHFDTTIANVLLAGGEPVDIPGPEAREAAPHPFKGNLDLDRLAEHLDPGHRGPKAARVILTVTDNAGGGHPVSPDHARKVAELARAAGVPFFLDAARFAENAHLITRRDPAARGRTAAEVARELFRLADGSWCSMKKDAFGNIGGFLTPPRTTNSPNAAATCSSPPKAAPATAACPDATSKPSPPASPKPLTLTTSPTARTPPPRSPPSSRTPACPWSPRPAATPSTSTPQPSCHT